MLGVYRDLAEKRGAALVVASDTLLLGEGGRSSCRASPSRPRRWHRKDGIYLLWARRRARAGHPTRGAAQVCSTLLALLGLHGPRLAERCCPASWLRPARRWTTRLTTGRPPRRHGRDRRDRRRREAGGPRYVGAARRRALRPGDRDAHRRLLQQRGLVLRAEGSSRPRGPFGRPRDGPNLGPPLEPERRLAQQKKEPTLDACW